LLITFLHTPRPPPTSTLFPYTTLFRSCQQQVVDGDINPSRGDARQRGEYVEQSIRLSLRSWLRRFHVKGSQLEEKISRGTRLASDRKSTRLNSSHVKISYAVFCLKKKK